MKISALRVLELGTSGGKTAAESRDTPEARPTPRSRIEHSFLCLLTIDTMSLTAAHVSPRSLGRAFAESPPILRLPQEVLETILSLAVSCFGEHDDHDQDCECDSCLEDGIRHDDGYMDEDEKGDPRTEDKGDLVGEARRSPLQDIRSTCRQFRRIANQLTFWFDDDLDIGDISPSPSNRK